MAEARPFCHRTHLFGTADHLWWGLSATDWLEAFSHHPRIGDLEGLRERFARTADWANTEQAGVADASDETMAALSAGNQAYEERFGFLFLVCATGLSATEMLTTLNARIGNPPLDEIRFAAAEQAKITRLRLAKLEPQ